MSIQDLYDQAAGQLVGEHADIETTRIFGSPGLKTRGKTFAMIVKGELVVKLPRQRVDQLVDTGDGKRFDPGHGRLMKEWVSLTPPNLTTCLNHMTEALRYVKTTRR